MSVALLREMFAEMVVRKSRPIEVLLIATFRDGLIHRLWELTWPDWTRFDEFADYPR